MIFGLNLMLFNRRKKKNYLGIFYIDHQWNRYGKRFIMGWLQNGYKNPENTEKINIFRKSNDRKPLKHAICHQISVKEKGLHIQE